MAAMTRSVDEMNWTREAAELDARIAAAFADDPKSDGVRHVLAAAEAATKTAKAEAEDSRARALDPLVADVVVARRAMDDAAFKRDRLTEAAKRLAKRVEELKALEEARRQRAEHERVSAERERLAAEFGRMAETIVQIGRLVRQIDICDREIGRLNASTALQHGHIPIVLAGATPAIKALFQEALVWDAFNAVAGLPSKAA
jgi:hypothetical protein